MTVILHPAVSAICFRYMNKGVALNAIDAITWENMTM